MAVAEDHLPTLVVLWGAPASRSVERLPGARHSGSPRLLRAVVASPAPEPAASGAVQDDLAKPDGCRSDFHALVLGYELQSLLERQMKVGRKALENLCG